MGVRRGVCREEGEDDDTTYGPILPVILVLYFATRGHFFPIIIDCQFCNRLISKREANDRLSILIDERPNSNDNTTYGPIFVCVFCGWLVAIGNRMMPHFTPLFMVPQLK